MKSYEVVAKTADEAVEEIVSVLGVGIDEIDIEIEEEQAKGFFGIFGKKAVKVRGTVKEDVLKVDSGEETISKVLESKSEDSAVKSVENTTSAKPEVKAASMLSPENEKVIKDFFYLLAKNVNKSIDINVKAIGSNIVIDIKGDDLSILIGRHGKTLEAMRYLLSLMVNKDKDNYKRIILDVEGYRKKRDDSIERLARNVATRVIKTKKEVKLDPMNPYERRIVHSTLQRNRLVATRSEGEDPYRHVVVYLK